MLQSKLHSTGNSFFNYYYYIVFNIITLLLLLLCITTNYCVLGEFNNNTLLNNKKLTESYHYDYDVERQLESGRIIGGTVVTNKSEYPSFVYNGYGCGGTLIHPDIVLTAAHCKYKDFPVFIGGIMRNGNDSEKIKAITEIHHPKYNAWKHRNDIMLVVLANTSNATLQFVLNTNTTYPDDGTDVTVIGLGQIYDGAVNYTGGLRQVDINIINYDTCRKALRRYYSIYNKEMICAGIFPDGGKDSCPGDSGGPLFITTTTNTSITDNTTNITTTTTIVTRNQIGIVSFGRGCGRRGLPGVYTRVSNYYDWIQATICNYSAVPPPGCSIIIPTPAPTPKSTSCPCPKFLIFICRRFLIRQCS